MPSADVTIQLIVTADDFNLSGGVSRGILEAHHRGIVTETSMMVNLGDLQQASAMLASAPQLAAGLHLNITRGHPVAPPSAVAELLGPDGQFLGSPQALPLQMQSAAVRAEFQAQVDSFRARPRPPAATCRYPSPCPPTSSRLRGAPRSRRVAEGTSTQHRSPMRATMTARGLGSPKHFLGDADNEPYWTVTRLLATIQGLRPGVTELMCHPGYFDDAIAYSRYGRQRDVERQALCAPEVAAALREQGVQLVTYAALQ